MELAGFPSGSGAGDRVEDRGLDSDGFPNFLRVSVDAAVGGEAAGSPTMAAGRKFVCSDLNLKEEDDGEGEGEGEGGEEEDGSDVDLMKRSFRLVNGVAKAPNFRFDLNLEACQSDASPEESPKTASPVDICVKDCVFNGFGSPKKHDFAEILVEQVNLVESSMNGKDENEGVLVENKDCELIGNSEFVSDAYFTGIEEKKSDFVTPKKRGRKKGSKKEKRTPQTGLRRSARRALADSHNPTTPPAMVIDRTPSVTPPAMVIDRTPSVCSDCEEGCVDQNCDVPMKLALPPPSSNLKTNELPIFDVFSVYSCLRSFSTILFLSPFSLENFVMSLKCKFANPLTDSIHLSVLKALRLMLESLASEGSLHASECLRDLNWDLLDAVTWPLYLSEYLLVFYPVSKSDSRLSQYYEPLTGEYYKLDETIKLDILRCMCDELMQSEIIRLELVRRNPIGRTEFENGKNEGNDVKGRDPVYEMENPGLTEEIAEEDMVDLNSDECWLCQMEGSLICCDGCPAAYHTKCVGLARNLLPEGDWYCMECNMKRNDGWMKPSHPLRGAELLGIDHYGMLYFGTFGYLLIADSCEQNSSCCYYNKNDIPLVMEVLKSDISYSCIASAISTYWDFSLHSSMETQGDIGKYSISEAINIEITAFHACKTDGFTGADRRTPGGEIGECVFESGMISGASIPSEASTKASLMAEDNLMLCSKEAFSECTDSCVADELTPANPLPGSLSYVTTTVEDDTFWMQGELQKYHNHYIFGQTASTIAEEMKRKSFHGKKDQPLESVEEIVSSELEAIAKSAIKWCWPSIRRLHENVWKENCGWCFSCRSSSDGGECLFNTSKLFPVRCDSSLDGLEGKNRQDSHVVSVICHILSVENRLKGLLTGSLENLQHSYKWRNDVEKASDVVNLKDLLMVLESSLRLIVLSPEWLKQADSAATAGSASHVSVSSADILSTRGFSKKKTRKISGQRSDSNFSFHAKSTIQWWRGGKLSRQVFNLKMLPHQLASLGARQGGCRKIPGIFYPDGSELAKRSKRIAWRAAVEASVIVAHLAYQVKDLELNIRWNDISSTDLFPKLSKESNKLVKPLKNVIIRQKRFECEQAQYLLDLGRRKTVPKMVTEHGILVDNSTSERKKFWMSESFVPLSLIKAFEMKKLANSISKKGKVDLSRATYTGKKLRRKNGLSYLFLKTERGKHKVGKLVLEKMGTKRKSKSMKKRHKQQEMVEEGNESYQCGHCLSNVLIREALKCKFCKHFFHKRHVRVSNENTSRRTYACYKCQRRKRVKPSKAKQKLPERTGMMTRSAAKKKIYKPVKKRKRSYSNEGKIYSKKRKRTVREQMVVTKKETNPVNVGKCISDIPLCKGKRGRKIYSYWLNGVRWTRIPDDERGLQFRNKKVILPYDAQIDGARPNPTCSLCNSDHHPGLIYISCEVCDGWFHGEAFGVVLEKSDQIIGFRCHNCRMEDSPTCLYFVSAVADESRDEENIDVVGETEKLEMENLYAVDEDMEGVKENDCVLKPCKDDAVCQDGGRPDCFETDNNLFRNLSEPLEDKDPSHDTNNSGIFDADSQNGKQLLILKNQISRNFGKHTITFKRRARSCYGSN